MQSGKKKKAEDKTKSVNYGHQIKQKGKKNFSIQIRWRQENHETEKKKISCFCKED